MIGSRAAAEAVPEIGGAGEAAAPRAAVFADRVQRLDHQRVLADALGHGRELPGLDELRQLRRFLESLGGLPGLGDDLRSFELADEGGLARALRERPHGDGAAEEAHHENGHESRPSCRH